MKIRTRKAVIWVIVILITSTAAFLSRDPSILIDNAAILASLLLILSLVVTSWRLKRRLKVRMKTGLGREVEDTELTSINAWMQIPDQAARAGRDAEKYDFD